MRYEHGIIDGFSGPAGRYLDPSSENTRHGLNGDQTVQQYLQSLNKDLTVTGFKHVAL